MSFGTPLQSAGARGHQFPSGWSRSLVEIGGPAATPSDPAGSPSRVQLFERGKFIKRLFRRLQLLPLKVRYRQICVESRRRFADIAAMVGPASTGRLENYGIRPNKPIPYCQLASSNSFLIHEVELQDSALKTKIATVELQDSD
jgi:hypothetical protein